MIGSKIKEGVEYAVYIHPRKGVDESILHTLTAHRVQVLEKNVERFAETAQDAYGNITGNYKKDGVKGERLHPDTGQIFGEQGVYKARDFLMPWDEYKERRKEIDTKAAQEAAERKERMRVAAEKHEAAMARLNGVEGLIWYPKDDWHVRDNSPSFIFSADGVNFLLGRMSDMVYEMLRDQDE